MYIYTPNHVCAFDRTRSVPSKYIHLIWYFTDNMKVDFDMVSKALQIL